MAAKKPYDEVRELDSLVRLLALKTIQVVVQSRLGVKIRTYCKAFSYNNDCFSVAVNDLPSVVINANKIVDNYPILHRLPLSIEISLKTIEGNTMVLEVWTLGLFPYTFDQDAKSSYNLHKRLGLMLKSLISISRVMPAYKISRNQDPDSYTIFYRLHLGDYDFSVGLGNSLKEFRFSKIHCCKGTLFMSVMYRTNMVIDLQQMQSSSSTDSNIMVIETPKRIVDLSKPLKLAAFVDTTNVKEFTDVNFLFPEEPFCNWLLELAETKYDYEYTRASQAEEEAKAEEALNAEFNRENIKNKRNSIWKMNLFDDFKFMKELNCAFATASPIGELAIFYREFHNAPDLITFQEYKLKSTLLIEEFREEYEIDIAEELQILEDALQEYDQMITDICQYSNEYI